MNNKKVVMIAAVIVIAFLTMSAYITIKNKYGKKYIKGVEIKCNGSDTSGDIKVYDTFNCKLAGTNYTFTVKSVDNDVLTIKASDYGLTDIRSDGTMSLEDKKNTFTIEKGQEVKIAPQVTDSSERMTISWK